MRLINTRTLRLETFPDERGLKYAILSHRWGPEEVLFEHMKGGYDVATVRQMKGFDKIQQCCAQALSDDMSYAWVDTCCIDKNSSAELQEAINSMFNWYKSAKVCYAYLSDVSCPDTEHSQFRSSEWFRRGWTLQELVAPIGLRFFDANWTAIGYRHGLVSVISDITGIRESVLVDSYNPNKPLLIAEVMSWAAGRQTTRLEDQAYSLIGLFDVNMAMLYGEGRKAFRRLLEEIIKNTDDQSVFAWDDPSDFSPGLLATSPDDFASFHKHSFLADENMEIERHPPHSVRNNGISLSVRLFPWKPYVFLATLNLSYVAVARDYNGPGNSILGMFVAPLEEKGFYARVQHNGSKLWFASSPASNSGSYVASRRYKDVQPQTITVVKVRRPRDMKYLELPSPEYGFHISKLDRDEPITDWEVRVSTSRGKYDTTRKVLTLSPGLPVTMGGIMVPINFGDSDIAKFRIWIGLLGQFVPYCYIPRLRRDPAEEPELILEELIACQSQLGWQGRNSKYFMDYSIEDDPLELETASLTGEYKQYGGNIVLRGARGSLDKGKNRIGHSGSTLLSATVGVSSKIPKRTVLIMIGSPYRTFERDHRCWELRIHLGG